MHYFKRNIGDYHKKAGRLSMLEHGAYTLLMDACYDREQFPTIEKAYDWCWAKTDDEKAAVRFVLEKFFTEKDGVYFQQRIQDEIEKYHSNSSTNARIAREREERRRTKREQSVNASKTNLHLTINHKPRTNKKTTLSGKPDGSAAKDVLDHLNKKTGRNYQPVTAHLHMINARIKDFSVEDCIAVIDMKVSEWLSDEKMNQYLRPATLFNATNFASYQGTIGQSSIKLSPNFWMER